MLTGWEHEGDRNSMMRSHTWAGSYLEKVPDYGVRVTHRPYTSNKRISSTGLRCPYFKREWKQSLVQKDIVSSISLFRNLPQTPLPSCGPVVWGGRHHNTGWKSWLMEVSRPVREVSVNHSGNQHCRDDRKESPEKDSVQNVERGLTRRRRRWRRCAFAVSHAVPWTKAAETRNWAREDKCFPIKVYSWWHCTTGWAPQSGQGGRRYGPGWPDCTWAMRARCTAPTQICRENATFRVWGGPEGREAALQFSNAGRASRQKA